MEYIGTGSRWMKFPIRYAIRPEGFGHPLLYNGGHTACWSCDRLPVPPRDDGLVSVAEARGQTGVSKGRLYQEINARQIQSWECHPKGQGHVKRILLVEASKKEGGRQRRVSAAMQVELKTVGNCIIFKGSPGDLMKLARVSRGLSQKQLAELTEETTGEWLNASHIGLLETAQYVPSWQRRAVYRTLNIFGELWAKE